MGRARRATTILPLVALVLLAASWSALAASGTRIHSGTYRGRIRCVGSDRFSAGAATRHYRSHPRVSVSFGSRQRLRRWTYLFLGRKDLVIHTRAVKAGQSFTYSAGAHIGRPGTTTVTITEVAGSAGRVVLSARLDWVSASTGYFGSGTFMLLLERLSAKRIRYDAVKVVVKQPSAPSSAANPVVRRNEVCAGLLGR